MDHLHGLVAVGPDRVVAGTHGGARLIMSDGAVEVQGDDRDDLKGMTGTAGTSTLASSGHPGPGSDLPDPVGLLTSRDAGITWDAVSLQGQVDFHALAIAGRDVVGYGGGESLMISPDEGRTWEPGAAVQPASLAYSGRRLLATTRQDLQVSGGTFRAVAGAPLMVLVSAGTDRTVLGLDPKARVWSSEDAGRAWRRVGRVPGAQAVAAHADGRGYAIAQDTQYSIG